MTLYECARRHAIRMAWALLIAIVFVLAVDWAYGHSTIAFAIAIFGLIWLNMPMLGFNCPRCGHNAFFRGVIVVPWPRKTCGKCGLELDRPAES
ncbi:hypothetical protein [Erythrobacter sp. THAF29]|uniref:hypothetical protein n=1 Tax=Erythrobacter sp. THAF29 TaxID=2587851 RepID=UPI0012696895|nr:hypothetical protein [Erythrobacter sp. THAF29]QFT78121.1 hypothetical protein FIU90_11280 [Erythrobacter sp. THAF29]